MNCSRCGAERPADSPGGHCPRCLVAVALAETSEDGSNAFTSLPRSIGGYELLEEIARGGMGVVYRDRQVSLKRNVALKMILAGEIAGVQAIKRFRQEAQAVARLQHPHIVAIHEVGEHEGQPFFTMDLVEGHTLAEAVRNQPLPARKAAHYLKEMAGAVHYAHECGILHRDLKPSNVLIDPFDQPRITDFGLARSLDFEEADGHRLTLTGQALGSPGYMPPEQGCSSAVGRTGDVYSLGAILYHLIAGRAPFQGETVADVLLQVRSAEPVSPRRLNPSVPSD